jgi:hypothetical protein
LYTFVTCVSRGKEYFREEVARIKAMSISWSQYGLYVKLLVIGHLVAVPPTICVSFLWKIYCGITSTGRFAHGLIFASRLKTVYGHKEVL